MSATLNGDEMTYGEQAVGMNFNPSGEPKVDRVKKLFAEIIDLCYDERLRGSGEQQRYFSIAITEAQTSQMWAVKALVWREGA
jgi:hypothetical protein